MKLTAEAEMDYSEIWVVGHVFYDPFKRLTNSRKGDYHDWFVGRHQAWMAIGRCCLDLQQPVWYRILLF
jgi:hypothetical protein